MPASDTVAPVNLVGITEIGELLGVTRQRAAQIVESKGFPKREDDPPLAMGPVWRRSTIEKWAEKTGPRKPGRPSTKGTPS